MKEFFKGLSPTVRGIIILIVIAVIIFIGWQVYQYFKKKAEDKPQKLVIQGAESEVNKLLKGGAVPTSSDATYQGTANAIAKLLDGCETDDSERDVIDEIKKTVKAPIDWYKLIVAFGNRDISDCGSFGQLNTNYDLISLLKDQLDTYLVFPEFAESKTVLSRYLQTIGIVF